MAMSKSELRQALKNMRKLALRAIEIADRCHGGHSYQSLGSDAARKCCEARMEVDDMKKEYTKQSDMIAAAGED